MTPFSVIWCSEGEGDGEQEAEGFASTTTGQVNCGLILPQPSEAVKPSGNLHCLSTSCVACLGSNGECQSALVWLLMHAPATTHQFINLCSPPTLSSSLPPGLSPRWYVLPRIILQSSASSCSWCDVMPLMVPDKAQHNFFLWCQLDTSARKPCACSPLVPTGIKTGVYTGP